MTTQTKLFFVFPKPGSRVEEKVGRPELWTGSIPAEMLTDNPETATHIVVLGGDGTFLHAIGEYYGYGKPFFGIHFGTVGFLMNRISSAQELIHCIDYLEVVDVHMIHAVFICKDPTKNVAYPAFNDIYFNAPAGMVCRGWIQGDAFPRHEFQGDGLIVATPQGSTAYHLSAGGSILPLGFRLMGITTICAQGRAIHVPVEEQKLSIHLENCAPVIAHADGTRIEDVTEIHIAPDYARVHIAFIKGSDFRFRRLKQGGW